MEFIRQNINGILGTVVFHLLIVTLFMAAKLSSVNNRAEESMLIEFAYDVTEEEFRELTERIMAERELISEPPPQVRSRNIAVNVSEERPVPDDFRDMSSEQLAELDNRMNEILQNAANGIMPEPEQPEFDFNPQNEIINLDEKESGDDPYSGPTTITYDLQGRSHIRIPVPVYRCPDGGVVEVMISVDRQGRVIRANVNGSPSGFNEICIFETAMEASLASRFEEMASAPPVQTGTITFYFQKQ